MGRPRKQTVDYFPHFVSTDSRTKFILEQGWGNDGYAFWFKLLELLGRSEGHYYDCSQPADKMYLVALTKVTEEQADAILDMLALRGNIDLELWQERKVIWCQSLVDNLQDVYSKRTVSAPSKPFTAPEEERADQDPADEPEPEEKPRKRGRPKKTETPPGEPKARGCTRRSETSTTRFAHRSPRCAAFQRPGKRQSRREWRTATRWTAFESCSSGRRPAASSRGRTTGTGRRLLTG